MKPIALTQALIRQPAQTLRIIKSRLRTALYNLGLRLGGAIDGYPLPPARLVDLVVGSRELAWYQLGGMFMSKSITTILRRNGTPIESFKVILDFGCGCGRVLRWLAALRRTADIWGCDYNPVLVGWCQTHLSQMAQFKVNNADPPLPFEDDTFDFVYSYSVLTHLSVDNQQPWMTELARVLRPGGRLLVTVHGKRVAWRGGLPAETMRRLENEGVLAFEEGRSGTNHCCAFHAPRWMREQESIGLELIEHMEGGANDGSEQDIYLFRAASVPAAAERPTNDVC